MSQHHVVMAFRKRLSNRGYTQIRIFSSNSGTFLVSALEPLAGFGVQVEMTLAEMYYAMR